MSCAQSTTVTVVCATLSHKRSAPRSDAATATNSGSNLFASLWLLSCLVATAKLKRPGRGPQQLNKSCVRALHPHAATTDELRHAFCQEPRRRLRPHVGKRGALLRALADYPHVVFPANRRPLGLAQVLQAASKRWH